MFPHTSVLLSEWLECLKGKSLKTYVDCTLGAGGHAEEVLKEHPEIERFIGIDQDPDALEIAKERLGPWKDKTSFFSCNFSEFDMCLDSLGITEVDGMLFDLGVSSMQLDRPERGFSFSREGPLDMRMNPKEALTAEIIVNTWIEKELGRIIRDYGEEKKWRQAARAIFNARREKPITTTRELAAVLQPVFRYTKTKINPLTLVFQALRIAVNRELEVIEVALPLAISRMAPQGVLGVISFHSLEDRIVKNVFRDAASDKVETSGLGTGLFLSKDPTVIPVTRKPLGPKPEEIELNPRSRSAKLRVVEKR